MATTTDGINKDDKNTDGTILSSKSAGIVAPTERQPRPTINNDFIGGDDPHHIVHSVSKRRADIEAQNAIVIEQKHIDTISTIQKLSDDIHEAGNNNDFGFTFSSTSQESLISANELEKLKSERDKAVHNLTQVSTLFLNLLTNLNKNVEQPNIYWPDREKRINDMIIRINALKEI